MRSSPNHNVIVINPRPQRLVGQDTSVAHDDAATAAEAEGTEVETSGELGEKVHFTLEMPSFAAFEPDQQQVFPLYLLSEWWHLEVNNQRRV